MERTDMHRLQDLVRLHRLGTWRREVARLTQMSLNTERRYREALEAAVLLAGDPEALPEPEVLKDAVLKAPPIVQPEQQVSSITRWEPDIRALLRRPRFIL